MLKTSNHLSGQKLLKCWPSRLALLNVHQGISIRSVLRRCGKDIQEAADGGIEMSRAGPSGKETGGGLFSSEIVFYLIQSVLGMCCPPR